MMIMKRTSCHQNAIDLKYLRTCVRGLEYTIAKRWPNLLSAVALNYPALTRVVNEILERAELSDTDLSSIADLIAEEGKEDGSSI